MRLFQMSVTVVWILHLIKLRWLRKENVFDLLYFILQKEKMNQFNNETVPKASEYFEKLLDKNDGDEVYCVGNKVSL